MLKAEKSEQHQKENRNFLEELSSADFLMQYLILPKIGFAARHWGSGGWGVTSAHFGSQEVLFLPGKSFCPNEGEDQDILFGPCAVVMDVCQRYDFVQSGGRKRPRCNVTQASFV